MRRVWPNLILGVALLLIVGSGIAGPPSLWDLAALRRNHSTLEATRDHLLSENNELTAGIARLRSDDAYLQRLIRSELGYARADELVYRFPNRNTAETH